MSGVITKAVEVGAAFNEHIVSIGFGVEADDELYVYSSTNIPHKVQREIEAASQPYKAHFRVQTVG